MAVQFHELPVDVFPPEARPFIARLNHELRELFALEGVIRQPLAVRRSDASVVRRGAAQVHTSRITPSIASLVAGSSTVVGTPNLTFGLVNVAGTTNTALSVNSSVRLFDTTAPEGVSTAAATGSAGLAARRDHVHAHPTFASGDLHTDLLPRSGVRDMTGELVTDVGTFGSSVASGGVGFLFETLNSFGSGTVFRAGNSGTTTFEQSFEGHAGVAGAASAQNVLSAIRTITADNRSTFRSIAGQAIVRGAITGGAYAPTHEGVNCSLDWNPTSTPVVGNATLRGAFFQLLMGALGATKTITNAQAGIFQTNFSGYLGQITAAAAGYFNHATASGSTVTNIYGVSTGTITFGVNRWGGSFANRVAIASPAADAQEVLRLTQSNTGGTTGSHILFNDKAGDPPAPSGGDFWRNGAALKFYDGTRTLQFAQFGTSATVTGHSATSGTTVTHSDTFTGNTGSAKYTISDLVYNLKQTGILAA